MVGFVNKIFYIFPTKSKLGAKVLSPSFHFAGQTSAGWSATYWAAFSFLSNSEASLPIPPALISTICILPSGSTTKVPLSASHFF